MDHSHRAAADRPRWIWAALGVVALAAMAGWWTLTGTNDSQAGAPGSESASRPDPVQDFVEFADPPAQTAEGTGDASFIAEGLRKLAGAVGTLAVGGADLQVDLRVAAEHVLLSPDDPAVTLSVRESLARAAEAIGDAHPDGRTALPDLIDDIDPMRPLLEQEATIRTVFRETSRALAPQATTDRAR